MASPHSPRQCSQRDTRSCKILSTTIKVFEGGLSGGDSVLGREPSAPELSRWKRISLPVAKSEKLAPLLKSRGKATSNKSSQVFKSTGQIQHRSVQHLNSCHCLLNFSEARSRKQYYQSVCSPHDSIFIQKNHQEIPGTSKLLSRK